MCSEKSPLTIIGFTVLQEIHDVPLSLFKVFVFIDFGTKKAGAKFAPGLRMAK